MAKELADDLQLGRIISRGRGERSYQYDKAQNHYGQEYAVHRKHNCVG